MECVWQEIIRRDDLEDRKVPERMGDMEKAK